VGREISFGAFLSRMLRVPVSCTQYGERTATEQRPLNGAERPSSARLSACYGRQRRRYVDRTLCDTVSLFSLFGESILRCAPRCIYEHRSASEDASLLIFPTVSLYVRSGSASGTSFLCKVRVTGHRTACNASETSVAVGAHRPVPVVQDQCDAPLRVDGLSC
jgi:hypothetical protein